jgi:hypothetical protein
MPAEQIQGLIRQKFPEEVNALVSSQPQPNGGTPGRMPIYTIQTPSGRKLTIQAPDETTALRGAREWEDANAKTWQAPNSQPPSEQPHSEQPFDPRTLVRNQQIGFQAIGRGIADIAGAPVDLLRLGADTALGSADMLANLVGTDIPEEAKGYARAPLQIGFGSDDISDLASRGLETVGVEPISEEEMSGRERVGYEATRFATGGFIPSAGFASRAKNASRVAAPAATWLGRRLQEFSAPYMSSPVRTVIGDTAAGAGAGTALAGYDEYAPEAVQESGFDPVARLFAVLAGGVSGARAARGIESVAKGGASGAKAFLGLDRETNLPFYNEETGQHFKRTDLDDAASLVQSYASDPQAAAQNLSRVPSEMPDYSPVPTSGILSDDAGLSMAENQARRKAPKPFVERDRRVGSQVRSSLDDLAPSGSTGRHFTDYGEDVQRQRVGQAQADLENSIQGQEQYAAQRRAEGDTLAAQSSVGPAAAAAIDRSVVDDSLLPVQAANSAAYQAARDAPQSDINIALISQQAERLPPDAISILDDQTQAVLSHPVSTVAALADAVLDLSAAETRARNAARVNPGMYRTADMFHDIRARIKEAISSAAQSGDEAARLYMEADANYAATMGQRFGRGPGDEAYKFRKDFNLDRLNRSTTPASQTAARFLQPNQPEKAQSLLRAGAQENDIRNYLMADLATSGAVDTRTGAINPLTVRAWADRWGATLDQFPRVRQEIVGLIAQAQRGQDSASQMAAGVRNLAWRVNDAERNIGALRFVLGKDPEHAIKAALNSGDSERAFQSLVQLTAGNEAARFGLKAAFKEYLQKFATLTARHKTSTGARPVSFKELDDLFNQHEGAMAAVFGQEDMHSLHQMHRVLRSFKNLELGANPGSQTSERFLQDFLARFEIGAKAYWGVLKGGGITRTLKLALKRLPAGNGINQIMHQMWFDPELARHLLAREVNSSGPAYNKKLLRLLAGAEAGRALGEGNE